MGQLATIGYEGADLDDFVQTLRNAGIDTLVDVRELPLSRRKGFSKRALSERLTSAGIDYIHLKHLGDPKPGRDAARAGRYRDFRKIFSEHLKTPSAREALADASVIAASSRSCLMCYERLPDTCHRSIVGKKIAQKLQIDVVHLNVEEGVSANLVARRRKKRESSNTRKSLAACG